MTDLPTKLRNHDDLMAGGGTIALLREAAAELDELREQLQSAERVVDVAHTHQRDSYPPEPPCDLRRFQEMQMAISEHRAKYPKQKENDND